MIPFSITLLHGLLICLPFTLFVLVSFWGWPRLWLHSLPPDIAAAAGPKSQAEEQATKYLLIVALVVLPGLSVLSTYQATRSIDLTFWGALVHIYSVWVVVHLWDFAVIDFAHALLINPAKPPIRGTENLKGWSDMRFHFRSLLKAVPASATFVLPAAWLLSWLL
ncbi:MAG: hypothetical protein KIS80_09415 [Anaerolineales bacterium]|nr:hypothetical protein [Anaerolineales bacterium]